MEIVVAFYKVKMVGGETFILRRIYQDLRYWLIGEEWANPDTPGFPEKYIWQEETQKKGKEMWIWWRPIKTIGPFTAPTFARRKLDINWHAYKFKDSEKIVNGKKFRVQKGNIEVFVKMSLVFEFKSWENGGPFLKSLFDTFWKRIYRKNIEMFKREALDDAYRLQGYLKRIMNMESWEPDEREHYPILGIPDTEF